MESLIIEAYIPDRDRVAIKTMLYADEYFDDIFQMVEYKFQEGIYVARYKGLTVGFLTFSGFKGRGAETTIFVSKEYRRKGIGTKLIESADKILSNIDAVERSMGACIDGDRDSLQFLYKHGYYNNHSSYSMEREGEQLAESNFSIRQYEDEDYKICQGTSELAFYKMREQVGILPSFYYAPDDGERKNFLENSNNRFVMQVDRQKVRFEFLDADIQTRCVQNGI